MARDHDPTTGDSNASTVIEVLRAEAHRDDTAVAYRFLLDGERDAETRSRGELLARAEVVAALLLERVEQGERALLMLPPGLAYLDALFGCLLAGVVAVPAFPPSARRGNPRLDAIVADARPTIALTTTSVVRALGRRGTEAGRLGALPTLALDALPSPPETRSIRAPRPDDLAVLQYTSGSTATPRGVALEHRHLVANVRAILSAARVAQGEGPFVAWLPPYHDMGLVGGILTPLFAGTEGVLFAPNRFVERPMRWLEAIARHRAVVSGAPDFAYSLVASRAKVEDVAELDLSSWRVAYSGAERVRHATLTRFVETFAPARFRASSLTPCYGLAEATLAVSFGDDRKAPTTLAVDPAELARNVVVERASANAIRLVGCGRLVHETEVRIVEPSTARECAPNAVGEIWVSSPSVARGYFERDEATRETFVARLVGAKDEASDRTFLRTGDLGFLRNGELFVTGRVKEMLVVAGQNHYPEDVESAVESAHVAVLPNASVAFSVDDEQAERLVVVSEVRLGDASEEDVVRAIRESVANARELEVHDVVLVSRGSVPRTTSGKRQRTAVKASYLADTLERVSRRAERRSTPEDEAPRGELESLASRTMAEVLGVDAVGRDTSFFALGATSLHATQLAVRLTDALEREVALAVIFDAPTPAGLAWRLSSLPPGPPRVRPCARPPGADAPLTASQERMWLVHALEPESSAYHVAGAITLEGPLEPLALESAIDVALRRHEVLRARYRSGDGVPEQTIAEHETFLLPRVDHASDADPAASVRARLSRLSRAPFDLAKGPAYRIELERESPTKHVLAFVAHHLVIDGYALDLLLHELLESYARAVRGEPLDVTPPDVGYLDYAYQRRAQVAEGGHSASLAYFRRELAGLAPSLELPTDRPRRTRPRSDGDVCLDELSPELVRRVEGFARCTGVTPFMVYLAAFDVLLSRLAGTSDVAVGTPIANRRDRLAEELVGTLVNTLVLRVDLGGDPTFLELLGRVKERCLGAFAHQDVPFELLVSDLAPVRAPGQTPLVQVMFDHQTIRLPDRGVAGLAVRGMPMERRGAQFDLACSLLRVGSRQLLSLEYRVELFDRSTIERLGRSFVAVLESALDDPSARISTLRLLAPEDRALVLASGRGRTRPYRYEAAPHAVEARTHETPGAIAVVHRDAAFTYAELERRVESLARLLAGDGARLGTRVAICLERGLDLVAALLATWRTGAAYVPLDPSHPAERLAWIVDDAAPVLLVTTSVLAAELPALTVRTRCLDVAPDDDDRAAFDAPPLRGDSAAYVLFTSGSTGRPKGVEVSHRALANFLQSMDESPGLGRADRILAVTTLSFDIAGLELFLPLTTGASLEIVDRSVAADGELLLARALDPSITLLQATPSTFRMLLDAGMPTRRELRCLVGGEAVPPDLATALLDRVGAVVNVYGPTETTIWSTLDPLVKDGEVTIGRPIDNTTVYVVDQHRRLLPLGVFGELAIGGDGVANGYVSRSDETARKFVPDPFGATGTRMYLTGDRVRMRSDGRLEFGGRFDHQVKIRGHRIELGEVETRLAALPEVARAVCDAREVRPGDVRLVAYCIAASHATIEPSAIRSSLRRSLPEPMIPAHVLSVSEFPLTSNGKIDRRRLPAPSISQQPEARVHVAPRDELEHTIARIFEEVLATKPVGAFDSFFDLGGHSLLALQVTSRVERTLGVRLPFRTLFDAPTVEELAETIARERSEQARGATVLADGGSSRAVAIVAGGPFDRMHAEELARALASSLGSDVSILFLHPPEAPYLDLAALASHHVRELSLVAPQGVRALVGLGFGGNVVHEMAHQLESRGETVDDVFLFDARPGPMMRPELVHAPGYVSSVVKRAPRWLRHVARLPSEERRRFLGSRAAYVRDHVERVLGQRSADDPRPRMEGRYGFEPDVAGYRDLPSPYYEAWHDHRHARVRADVHVLRAELRGLLPLADDLGWGAYAVKAPGITTLEDATTEARVREAAGVIVRVVRGERG